jgi:hypothetical protein
MVAEAARNLSGFCVEIWPMTAEIVGAARGRGARPIIPLDQASM